MLGISIYPQHQDLDELKKYVTLAHELGYGRIFSSLLEINDENKEEMLTKFKTINEYAQQLNFEVILDVNPQIFTYLNISYQDLSFFKNLHCSGLRLDEIMSPKLIADLTHNIEDLTIEINCSNGSNIIPSILEFGPIKRNLIACHNFYPQALSGLDFDYFTMVTKVCKQHNIRTAAFISANPKWAIYGPWVINEGICTLESHRNLPIHTQAKLLFATDLIDDVIIGNSFASKQELTKVATTNYDIIELDVVCKDQLLDVENEITFEFKHFRRGDITPIMIRSTMSRVAYENTNIIANNNLHKINYGDVIICNDLFSRYKGELHIILEKLELDERKNVIGAIANYDLELLKYITPWKHFKLVRA